MVRGNLCQGAKFIFLYENLVDPTNLLGLFPESLGGFQ
jgi:hypothetical protein